MQVIESAFERIVRLCVGEPAGAPFQWLVPAGASRTPQVRRGDTVEVDPRAVVTAGDVVWVRYSGEPCPRIEEVASFASPCVRFASGAVHVDHIEAMRPLSAVARRLPLIYPQPCRHEAQPLRR